MSWIGKLLGVESRNAQLRTWGQAVPVTEVQRAAMRELWSAWRAHQPPSADPLAKLSEADREYLKKICSADFRPPHFGDANTERMAGFMTCLRRGLTPEQAAVIIGMTLNMVGPIDF